MGVPPIKLKSVEEILARLEELVKRYRRRYLKRNLQPCPQNCKHAVVVGRKVVGCAGCGSHNPDFCKAAPRFVPLYSKEELADQFRQMMENPEILLQDYRDLVAFLFVLGQYDTPAGVISGSTSLGEEVRKQEKTDV